MKFDLGNKLRLFLIVSGDLYPAIQMLNYITSEEDY